MNNNKMINVADTIQIVVDYITKRMEKGGYLTYTGVRNVAISKLRDMADDDLISLDDYTDQQINNIADNVITNQNIAFSILTSEIYDKLLTEGDFP